MQNLRWKKIFYYLLSFLLLFVFCGWLLLYYQNHYRVVLLNPDVTKHFVKNNQVSLLINGVNSVRQRTQNIEEANVILLKTFEYHDDISGNALVDLLIKKAKQGALIFIQFDVKGMDNYPKDFWAIKNGNKSPIPPPLERLMKEAPNQVFIYPTNPPTSIIVSFVDFLGVNIPIDHEKYLITWNTKTPEKPVKVILGGMNIGDSYLLGGEKNAQGEFKILSDTQDFPWRDTDIELSGEVVQHIVHRFVEEANFQAKMPHDYIQKYMKANMTKGLTQLKSLVALMHQHAKTAFLFENEGVKVNYFAKNIYENKIEQALIYYIQQVPKYETIILVAPYFLPSKELQQALMDAVSRDIQVKILTNSTQSKNKSFQQVASAGRCRMRSFLSQLSSKHLKYYEYLGNSHVGFHSFHQKVWLLGENENAIFAIGSSNLDAQSLRINSETMLFMQNPQLQKQFKAMIANDMQADNIHEITLEELMHESISKRFAECQYDWIVEFVM